MAQIQYLIFLIAVCNAKCMLIKKELSLLIFFLQFLNLNYLIEQ
jgi:hypothetical protein